MDKGKRSMYEVTIRMDRRQYQLQVEDEIQLKRRSLANELSKKNEWEQDCFIRKLRRMRDREEKIGRSSVLTKLEYNKYEVMNYALLEDCARKCETLGKSKISDEVYRARVDEIYAEYDREHEEEIVAEKEEIDVYLRACKARKRKIAREAEEEYPAFDLSEP